ncbi:MAG: hypothetical protein DRH30_11170 [Deltaproteobacteria bacterium]|nr:MAG: hypothetical protein DRH30_11170 [Deltaproteobacteria bacterium]
MILRFGLVERALVARLVLIGLSLSVAACGSGGDGGGGGGMQITPAMTVQDALDNFQIDTAQTPRLDSDGDPLPEDYAPFGSSAAIERFAELAFLGFETELIAGSRLLIAKERPDQNGNFSAELLHSIPTSETPWIIQSGINPANVRAAAAGDFDGDGIEELAVVYHEFDEPFIELIIIDDEADGFAKSQPIIVSDKDPVGLAIAAGDFNGDSTHDLAVGIVLSTGGEVVFLEQGVQGLELSGDSVAITPAEPGWTYHMAMDAGNLDYDLGQELAIVFNEKAGSQGRSQHLILDDAGRDRAVLSSGPVRAEVDGQVFTAQVADVSIGNLDEDPLDEVVLGGLTNISGSTTSIKSWGYMITVLDDAKRNLEQVTATQFAPQWNQLSESGQSLSLNYLHVNALDIDGDRIDEIQANQFIFEDFINAAPWTEAYTIPDGEIIWESGDGSRRFGYENSTMVVGDVNSDKREDIIYISDAQDDVRVWALDVVDGFSEIDRINSVSGADYPLIIPVNVDDDSIALEYSNGTYKLVFTEPIVIAAMAAAPCNEAWGQNADACRTSYGTAESSTTSTENSQTITASASVGFSVEFSALGVSVGGFEAIATFSSEATAVQGTAYTLTQRVEHTTGPIEDGVLFTTIPIDQYTYIIVSHPNPELVGGEVVVSLPRDPITVLTRREFYNEAITPDAFHIDGRVFEHVAGDPTSYPSRVEQATLLSQFEGIQSREVDVGEGGGSVSVGVSVFEETSSGSSYSWNASVDIKATAGVVVTGMSVGYGEGNAVTLSSGSETNYTGTVANLDAENFTANPYSFGLFSYIYSDPAGQQFEVLNYWVHQAANNAP